MYNDLSEEPVQLLSIPPVKFNQGNIKVIPTQLIFPNGPPKPSTIKPIGPEFYTQMQTTVKGDGIYIHCLLVWEYVDPITVEESKPEAYQQPILIYQDFIETSPGCQAEVSDPSKSDQPGVFVPIAMCIETHETYFKASKEIMMALYNHYHDCSVAVGAGDLNYLIANTEFARNACFILNDLFIPPVECKINVKIGKYAIMYTADELDRLPHSEDCIRVLFEVLDISTIILLWKSLLLEKHVVIMSRSKYMCFNICEGMKALMFPLKWSFNYTPVLPKSMVDYLEAIFPTIFGVLSTVVSFDEVRKLSPNATIIDVETQNFSADEFELFCPRIEDQLRLKLQSLKLSMYSRLEKASVRRGYPRQKRFEVVSNEADLITQIRQAFLQIFVDAFSNLGDCFTYDSEKNEYEINPEIFLSALPECPGDHECNTFWKSLIESEHFIQFCLSKYSLENSYFSTFEKIVKSASIKKECPTYTMTSCLHPKAMYNSIWQILKKSPTNDLEKAHKFLKSSAEIFFNKNQEDIDNYQYFEDPESLAHQTSPRLSYRVQSVPASFGNFGQSAMLAQQAVEANFFYGSNGLYKFLRTLFGFMHEADFRQLSDNELLMQSLEDAPQNWQTHLIRASAYFSYDTDGEQVIEELINVSKQKVAAIPARMLIGVLPRLRVKKLLKLKLREDKIGMIAKFFIESSRPELTEGSESEADDRLNESAADIPLSSRNTKSRRFKSYLLPGQEAGALFTYKVKLLNERPWLGSSQVAIVVSGNLLLKLIEILQKFNFLLDNLYLTIEFQRFTNDMSALQLAYLSTDTPEESVCVHLNMFNVCLLHSLIEKNMWPKSRYEWNTQMRKSFYIINRCQCSVYELLDATLDLGTNETLEIDAYPFGKLEASQQLTAFGYFIPVSFSPRLKVYTDPSTVLADLKDNAATLLRTTRVISSDRVLKLPALIKNYGRLFGGTDSERLKELQKFMDDGTKERLKEAVRGLYRVEYEDFEWSLSFEAMQ